MKTPSSRPMPFELFVLACLKFGMETPYEVARAMGVGIGVTSPVLKRLAEKSFVTSSAETGNRTSYAITPRGEIELRDALQSGPTTYGNPMMRGVFDALPRTIYFAWLKCDVQELHQALDIAKATLVKKHVLAKAETEFCRDLLNSLGPEPRDQASYTSTEYLSVVFRFIKANVDAAELKQQTQALDSLKDVVGQMPPAPHTFLNDPAAGPEPVNDETTPEDGKAGMEV